MNMVDIRFRIKGEQIPVDHGFPLYSAISYIIPEIHGDDNIGIHPIAGVPIGDRNQSLTDKSFLTIRLPAESIKLVLPLAGKTLIIGENKIQVGVPNTHALIPSARLYSRLVVIKGFMEPEPFLDAVKRQLTALGVKGLSSLIEQSQIAEANIGKDTGSHSSFLRRTIRIHDKDIVGFALSISELTAEESIIIQENGIGGRHRFGCGIFIPDRR